MRTRPGEVLCAYARSTRDPALAVLPVTMAGFTLYLPSCSHGDPAEDCSAPVAASVDTDTCSSGVAHQQRRRRTPHSEQCVVVVAGCVAVSGTGNASNSQSEISCGAFIGAAAGCIAVSGTGDASNSTTANNCGSAGIGVFAGCIAISGTGDASNTTGANTTCGGILGGVGIGCVAISGTGNTASG